MIGECQDILEQLGAKRAELSYVANSLVNPLEGDRRQAFYFLGRQFFPEESGLRSENDLTRRNAAVTAWQEFAAKIAEDAAAPFPSGD